MPRRKTESIKIEKANKTGFCFGVRRAINILEKVAQEHGGVETLGEVVHNRQALDTLAEAGIRAVKNADDIQGGIVATSSHGITPQLEAEIRARHVNIINVTCPFVRRVQVAARRLAESGFVVVIYGDADHPEIKSILGWTDGKGIATLDEKFIATFDHLPRRLGVLSQTTQIPARFNEFVKKLIDSAFSRDSELRIIDTICHDIRERQQAALDLARRVDLIFVIGSRTSANTKHLTELCTTATETHLLETAEDIQPVWLEGHQRVGVASGASTAQGTIDEVLVRLKELGG